MDESQPDIIVTKTATCPTLSGETTLTYEVGTTEQDTYYRIVGNSGKGLFCKDWIALSQITDLLAVSSITSSSLKPLYPGKSANNAGFLLAALKADGIVRIVEGTTFRYTTDKPIKVRKGKP